MGAPDTVRAYGDMPQRTAQPQGQRLAPAPPERQQQDARPGGIRGGLAGDGNAHPRSGNIFQTCIVSASRRAPAYQNGFSGGSSGGQGNRHRPGPESQSHIFRFGNSTGKKPVLDAFDARRPDQTEQICPSSPMPAPYPAGKQKNLTPGENPVPLSDRNSRQNRAAGPEMPFPFVQRLVRPDHETGRISLKTDSAQKGRPWRRLRQRGFQLVRKGGNAGRGERLVKRGIGFPVRRIHRRGSKKNIRPPVTCPQQNLIDQRRIGSICGQGKPFLRRRRNAEQTARPVGQQSRKNA